MKTPLMEIENMQNCREKNRGEEKRIEHCIEINKFSVTLKVSFYIVVQYLFIDYSIVTTFITNYRSF